MRRRKKKQWTGPLNGAQNSICGGVENCPPNLIKQINTLEHIACTCVCVCVYLRARESAHKSRCYSLLLEVHAPHQPYRPPHELRYRSGFADAGGRGGCPVCAGMSALRLAEGGTGYGVCKDHHKDGHAYLSHSVSISRSLSGMERVRRASDS